MSSLTEERAVGRAERWIINDEADHRKSLSWNIIALGMTYGSSGWVIQSDFELELWISILTILSLILRAMKWQVLIFYGNQADVSSSV